MARVPIRAEERGMLENIRGRKIALEGFNNLTKALSFNIYDICYARSKSSQEEYLEYIDEKYNSHVLRAILEKIASIIKARIVNLSTQDYDPRGASVTALITEDLGIDPESPYVLAHLDKSHMAVHTYPETNARTGIATFRVDIDIATCGTISPLRALSALIHSFDSDIVLMDYRVRGFTRDVNGRKVYIDHDITTIQDYVPDAILNRYIAYDINIISDNMFHTKMMIKKLDLDNYLFDTDSEKFTRSTRGKIRRLLSREMQEIFECTNLYEE